VPHSALSSRFLLFVSILILGSLFDARSAEACPPYCKNCQELATMLNRTIRVYACPNDHGVHCKIVNDSPGEVTFTYTAEGKFGSKNTTAKGNRSDTAYPKSTSSVLCLTGPGFSRRNSHRIEARFDKYEPPKDYSKPKNCGPNEEKGIDGKCVPKKAAGCPKGQHQDSNGVCVVTPCPPGQHRDASGTCVPRPCPAGQHRSSQGSCVPTPCPTGQIRNSVGACVRDPNIRCPQGQRPNAQGQCVAVPVRPGGRVACLLSQKWDDRLRRCVNRCPAGKTYDRQSRSCRGPCPSGWVNGQCLPWCPPCFPRCTVTMRCRPRHKLTPHRAPPPCPTGQVRRGGRCQQVVPTHRPTGACPRGQVRTRQGQCAPNPLQRKHREIHLKTTGPVVRNYCPPGSTRNPDGKTCRRNAPPAMKAARSRNDCGPHQYYFNGRCGTRAQMYALKRQRNNAQRNQAHQRWQQQQQRAREQRAQRDQQERKQRAASEARKNQAMQNYVNANVKMAESMCDGAGGIGCYIPIIGLMAPLLYGAISAASEDSEEEATCEICEGEGHWIGPVAVSLHTIIAAGVTVVTNILSWNYTTPIPKPTAKSTFKRVIFGRRGMESWWARPQLSFSSGYHRWSYDGFFIDGRRDRGMALSSTLNGARTSATTRYGLFRMTLGYQFVTGNVFDEDAMRERYEVTETLRYTTQQSMDGIHFSMGLQAYEGLLSPYLLYSYMDLTPVHEVAAGNGSTGSIYLPGVHSIVIGNTFNFAGIFNFFTRKSFFHPSFTIDLSYSLAVSNVAYNGLYVGVGWAAALY
jgi:hypothetical protein